MSDAYIIETSLFTAGIIAAHRNGFRFYASHPAMFPLEGKFFGTPSAAQRAAERLASDTNPAPPPRLRRVA